MNELLVKYLLYADHQLNQALSTERVQEMVTVTHEVLDRKEITVILTKMNMMVIETD